MTISQRLEAELKDAMRTQDKAKLGCIRQIKAHAQQAQNAPNFDGDTSDAFYQDVIGRYCKQLEKSQQELRQGGERGAALAEAYAAEVAYLAQYLPQAVGDAELRQAAQALFGQNGLDAKSAGRAMGQLMGRFKGRLTPARAKAAIDEALANRPKAG